MICSEVAACRGDAEAYLPIEHMLSHAFALRFARQLVAFESLLFYYLSIQTRGSSSTLRQVSSSTCDYKF